MYERFISHSNEGSDILIGVSMKLTCVWMFYPYSHHIVWWSVDHTSIYLSPTICALYVAMAFTLVQSMVSCSYLALPLD